MTTNTWLARRVRKYVQNLRRKLSEARPGQPAVSKPYVVPGIASSTTKTAMNTYRLPPMRLRASSGPRAALDADKWANLRFEDQP